MAQTQKPTTQGYAEIAKLVGGGASVVVGEEATCVKSVVCYEAACAAAAEASTYATPAATKVSDAGLSIVDADTVVISTTTVTDDTVQLDHQFTASAAKTTTGFGVCNDDNDILFAECCFAAGIAMETSDTLDVQMKITFKLGT